MSCGPTLMRCSRSLKVLGLEESHAMKQSRNELLTRHGFYHFPRFGQSCSKTISSTHCVKYFIWNGPNHEELFAVDGQRYSIITLSTHCVCVLFWNGPNPCEPLAVDGSIWRFRLYLADLSCCGVVGLRRF